MWDRIKSNVLPHIGKRPVSDIPASAFRDVAKRIEDRAPTIARQMLQCCSQIMRYAVAHDMAERNPVSDLQTSDVLKPHKSKNVARVDAKEVPALMHAIVYYGGTESTRLALRLLAMTFVRTSELIEATWDELDLVNARWNIPAERMKMSTPHIVPLSRQAVETFKRLKVITYGGNFVFPGRAGQTKPMSRATMLVALGSMGFGGKMTGHGFRGLASTAIKNSYGQYRELGARTRAMLLATAARRWGMDPQSLRTQAGQVIGPRGKKLGYGELADEAMKMPVPQQVVLKDAKDFRIIGHATPRHATPRHGTARCACQVQR